MEKTQRCQFSRRKCISNFKILRTSFLDIIHDESYVLLVINFIEVEYYAIVIESSGFNDKSSYDKQVCMELWGSANVISTFTSATFRKRFWNLKPTFGYEMDRHESHKTREAEFLIKARNLVCYLKDLTVM